MTKIDEAAEALRRAKTDHKRATERVKAATAALVQAMLDERVAVHEYHVGAERHRIDLRCPEPTVRLVFVGNER